MTKPPDILPIHKNFFMGCPVVQMSNQKSLKKVLINTTYINRRKS